jgi:hypothetical protein
VHLVSCPFSSSAKGLRLRLTTFPGSSSLSSQLSSTVTHQPNRLIRSLSTPAKCLESALLSSLSKQLFFLGKILSKVSFRGKKNIISSFFGDSFSLNDTGSVNWIIKSALTGPLCFGFLTSISSRQSLFVNFISSISLRQFHLVNLSSSISSCQSLFVNFSSSISLRPLPPILSIPISGAERWLVGVIWVWWSGYGAVSG